MKFTAFRSIKLQRGLHLEERVGCTAYQARAQVNGTVYRSNTETADFPRAQRIAEAWFRRLGDTPSDKNIHTMHEAAKSFLADNPSLVNREYHQVKWNAISKFFDAVDVDAVDTPMLGNFLRWRRERAAREERILTTSTLRKDLVTIRVILRHAVEQGWIARIPVAPKLPKSKPNPRPWLEPDEWQTLQRVAKARIAEADNPRSKRQREELWDFVLFQTHSCCRVDEVRKLRVRDCVVRQHPTKKRPYLEIHIRQSKTGARKAIAWSGAVTAFERQVKRHGLKDDDLLFTEHHRDGFRMLLEAAGLRTDAMGKPRNLKSLRSTGLAMRLKANPRLNLKLLAKSAGTSVAILDTFYLAKMTLDMGIDELV